MIRDRRETGERELFIYFVKKEVKHFITCEMICPKILATPTATRSSTRLHQHSRYRIDVKKKKPPSF